jgi:GT2 family glycosyltransferase
MTSRPVLAVVLTHNAPEALRRCLDAIDAQTSPPDRVLVVDNASDAGIDPRPSHLPTDVVRLPVNTGPGGGHAVGLARFLDSGAALAWVMDDDCVPDATCLERLLASARGQADDTLVLPYWVDVATGNGGFVTAWCGVLMSRALVMRLGLPRADFVWWAEDTEYLQWRVARSGLQPVEVGDAVVVHLRVRGSSRRPAWKIYYEVRNTVFFRLYVQRAPFRRFRWLFRSLAKLLGLIVVREDDKAAKLAAYGRGLFDGMTGRLGLRVPLNSP